MDLRDETGVRMAGHIFIGQSLVPPRLEPHGAESLIASRQHVPGFLVDRSENASGPLEHSVIVEFLRSTEPVRDGLLSLQRRPRR